MTTSANSTSDAGYVVRRFTGAQIRNHSALVVADLGEVLSGEAEP